MEGVHREIGLAHLEQLLDAELTDRTPPDDGEIPTSPDGLETLKDWSREQASHISDAIENRAFGGADGSPINWSYTFLGFMESCGVYLRDWETVLDAVEENRQGNTETALEKLNQSVAEIQELAGVWGLDFKMLCDLLNVVVSCLSGTLNTITGWTNFQWPFCGAFYSRNPSAPFVDVAFKGTTNWKDILVDGAYWTTKAADGIVHGTHVSRWPLDAMFNQRKRGQAFGLIHNGVSNIIDAMPKNTDGPVVTHVTGHSLGGSYSSICYTQFTESAGLPNGAAQGDMYTFESPRVGESDFASILKQELGPTTGSSWGVVNKDDIVTRIPPPGPWAGAFNHLDRAYEISPTEVPVSLPSEISQRPHGAFPVSGFENHRTKSYYAAMKVALNQ